jgi:hypothetical protein
MITLDKQPLDATRTRLWRSRWAAIGAAVAVSLGAGGMFVAQAAPGPAESTIVSVTPERILDTRNGNDIGLPGPFVSPVGQQLQVTGSIPTATGTKVVVPAGATGVLLNVTAVGATANGFISIRPGDATGTPSTSSLNVTAGITVPNSVQVSVPTAGANAGKIDITWDALGTAGPTTDMLIDVVAYTTNTGLQQLVADVALKANTATVDAALATKVTAGPVTMTQGPGGWSNNSGNPVGTFEQSSTGFRFSGDGFVNLMLVGPGSTGGVPQTLKDVTYCIRSITAPGIVDQVFVHGYQGTTSSNSSDTTDRSAAGCYTVTPSNLVRTRDSFMLQLLSSGGGFIIVTSVTTTWDSRTALGVSASDFVESPAPEGAVE